MAEKPKIMTKYKNFGGKRYELCDTKPNKKEANVFARKTRTLGFLVRSVKITEGEFKGEYLVYCRKKK